MLNISPHRLPARTPRMRRGFGNSPYAHMAVSMLMLAVAGGVAMYQIAKLHDPARRLTPAQVAVNRAEQLQKLAIRGSMDAQVRLASAFLDGDGVVQNAAESVRWNRAAAEQGNPIAQIRLAIAYETGTGVPRDLAQAAAWMKKAAEQDCAEAQCAYGIYRFQGVGTQKDVVDGYKWLDRAAVGGSDAALQALLTARANMTPEQLALVGR